MATNRDFNAMLNEYLPNKLLREELAKKLWIYNMAEKDESWLSGTIIHPFKATTASSVVLGSLAASNDIGKSKFTRGEITNQPEAWGSILLEERDLMEHGKLSEQNLLKILPEEINDLIDYFKNVVGLSMLNGPQVAKATGNGDASGNVTFDRCERFVEGQKVVLDDDNSATTEVYVNTINLDTGVVNFVTTRFGATSPDLSAYTTAQNAKAYFEGAETSGNRFSNLKDMLLSAANGGSANIYGVSKLASRFTQAINESGASITSSNILTKLYDFAVKMKNRGSPGASKYVMSYKHWGSIMKILEQDKGPFRKASDAKSDQFSWSEVSIGGPQGNLDIVAIQEIDDDFIAAIDPKAVKIYSNGGFKKRQDPQGNMYHTIRNTTGYQYIVDVCFFGDLVLERPNRCGILHTISY